MNTKEKIIGEEVLENVSGGTIAEMPDWAKIPDHPNCGGQIVQSSGGYRCERCGEEHEDLGFFFPTPFVSIPSENVPHEGVYILKA